MIGTQTSTDFAHDGKQVWACVRRDPSQNSSGLAKNSLRRLRASPRDRWTEYWRSGALSLLCRCEASQDCHADRLHGAISQTDTIKFSCGDAPNRARGIGSTSSSKGSQVLAGSEREEEEVCALAFDRALSRRLKARLAPAGHQVRYGVRSARSSENGLKMGFD